MTNTLKKPPRPPVGITKDSCDTIESRAQDWLRQHVTENMSVLEIGARSADSFFDVQHCDESIDLIIGLSLLDKTDYDRWSIQELWRILKPGGRLIISVADRLPRFLTRWRGSAFSSWLTRKFEKTTVFDCHTYSSDEICNLLTDNMFVIEQKCLVPRRSFIEPNRLLLSCRKLADDSSAQGLIFSDTAKIAETLEEENPGLFDQLRRWADGCNPVWQGEPLLDAQEVLGLSERWLVLSPHPDDELIGCGGTLIKAANQNIKITIVQMTDGSATSALQRLPEELRQTMRLEEATVVAAKLACQLELLAEPDGHLAFSQAMAARLSKIISDTQPGIIFVPFVNDPHVDHVATNRILCAVLKQLNLQPAPLVASYEVWSLVPGNTISIIDEQLAQKCRLLMDYRIPMRVKDYTKYCKHLHAYHGLQLTGKPSFAELFLTQNVQDFCATVERFIQRNDGVQ